jgi:phosphatidylserine decarboxylase
MATEPIQFFNRYTRCVETESVYGQAFLEWTYGNPLGRLALHALVKRAIFSRWYGWRMDRPASRAKVAPFIRDFGVDATEFADAPDSYRTFNEFFFRRLKPGARPVAGADDLAVFPADGRHLGFQDVSQMDGIFVKGAVFSLPELLRNAELAARYRDGTMILSRLCPVDYHRFHFPVAGQAGAPVLIPGPLYSVNPIALRRNIHIFTANKRAYCEITSEQFGRVLMFEIGATCVGSFAYTYHAGGRVAKGEEKGYFKFGGSSTITLFEKGRIELDADLREQTARRTELYARMGDRMGRSPA